MRVVVLIGDGGNQVALCHKLSQQCEIAAIVISENIPTRVPPFAKRLQLLTNRFSGQVFGREFVAVWRKLLSSYSQKYPSLPAAAQIRVRNVNDAETLSTIEKFAPELVVVSGTNLVGRKIIRLAREKGSIVNLHTGISPYLKGGPNCTNWCLAERDFHLIGSTVMWLDAGIDTGGIIATEQTPLKGSESLFDLHWKVMEHAHDLYVRAVRRIATGKSVPSVPQSKIAEGHCFYNADWTAAAMIRASRNFKQHYPHYFADSREHQRRTAELKLFPMAD